MRIEDNRANTLSPEGNKDDYNYEISLRPRYLDEFIGQDKIKSNLRVFITATKQRQEALDHCLFFGPPGLGKTTLATIIANELQVNIKTTTGPILEKSGDLAAILTNLSDKDILFIDEIHRIPKMVEEVLYPAMEDYKLDIIIGQGPSARTMKIPLPRFTLIGATTRTGLLTSPLRDRFGVVMRLEFYQIKELQTIINRSARLLSVEITDEASFEIAKRARGTPRIANRVLKRVRDFAQVKGDGVINIEIANEALNALDIDKLGLDDIDRKLLSIIIEKFNGGPAGIDAIAAALREDRETIEDVYEPYLLQEGFIERTSRGRVATVISYQHLGKTKPQGLF